MLRGSVVGLFDVGLVDTAFLPPDPDRDLKLREDFYQVKNLPRTAEEKSLRLATYTLTKRLIDVSVSAALLVALSPALLIIAAIIRLSSRGPIIYSQTRLTEGGRVFRMLKFRSMQVDAERHTGPVWAQEEDPRVTRFGKILRLSHLDELPQLINVIRGDMSLIGPRPERPELAAELREQLPQFQSRLAVKGGITGLAQISSGYAADFQSYSEKLSFDLEYIKNRSLLLDLSIALRTVLVVILGYGAR